MSAFLLGLGFRADMGTTIRKLVLLKLIDACHDDGSRIFPAIATVAQAAQCSTRQVQREIKAFLDVRLLKIVREGGKGPRSTHEYQLDLDILEAISKQGWASIAGETDEKKGDTVSPLDEADVNKGDTGDTLRVTPATDKGDTRSHPTPYDPSSDPSTREGGREAVLEKEELRADDPAKFAKRVKALEMGMANNPWPGALKSSTTWALGQFEKLTAEERRLAEERRDIYLAACNNKPVALGVYLRDRKFLDVAPIMAQTTQSARISVAPFGPIWASLRALALLGGPVSIDMPLDLHDRIRGTYDALAKASQSRALAYLRGKGVDLGSDGDLVFPDDFQAAEWRRRVLAEGFPEVNRLHDNARQRERDSAEARYARLADLCEAVPVGSDMFDRWRAHHVAAGWPFVPDPGTMRVVYFPKGGPDGLEEFKQAAQAAMTKERGDEHAA